MLGEGGTDAGSGALACLNPQLFPSYFRLHNIYLQYVGVVIIHVIRGESLFQIGKYIPYEV